MKFTIETIEAELERMKEFYVKIINQAADRAGGIGKLSLALGRDRTYMHIVLKRENFNQLRIIVALIMDKKL